MTVAAVNTSLAAPSEVATRQLPELDLAAAWETEEGVARSILEEDYRDEDPC